MSQISAALSSTSATDAGPQQPGAAKPKAPPPPPQATQQTESATTKAKIAAIYANAKAEHQSDAKVEQEIDAVLAAAPVASSSEDALANFVDASA